MKVLCQEDTDLPHPRKADKLFHFALVLYRMSFRIEEAAGAQLHGP